MWVSLWYVSLKIVIISPAQENILSISVEHCGKNAYHSEGWSSSLTVGNAIKNMHAKLLALNVC